jgi:hypothetical protein
MINKGPYFFTGNAGGICGYMSHGLNIIRKSSSLTAKRVEKDPAFAGFRKSGIRLADASRIAAALYNQIPQKKRQFTLYRMLTGQVFRMMKGGEDRSLIIEKLQKLYIDPILQQPKLHSRARTTRVHRKRRLQIATVDSRDKQSKYIFKESRLMAPKRSEAIPESSGPPATPGLIYMGRLKGYRRLRMWLIP